MNKMKRMKVTSPTASAYRNLGYRSQQHYTVSEAASYFGIGNSQFRKMMANPEITPTPPEPLGTERLRFYRKVDIHTMVETFPYWQKRRFYATNDHNGLHRIKLAKVKGEQIPLPLPTPTPIKKSSKPTPTEHSVAIAPAVEPEVKAYIPVISDMLDRRIAGVKLATAKHGMSIEEAAMLAKTGLFDA